MLWGEEGGGGFKLMFGGVKGKENECVTNEGGTRLSGLHTTTFFLLSNLFLL